MVQEEAAPLGSEVKHDRETSEFIALGFLLKIKHKNSC